MVAHGDEDDANSSAMARARVHRAFDAKAQYLLSPSLGLVRHGDAADPDFNQLAPAAQWNGFPTDNEDGPMKTHIAGWLILGALLGPAAMASTDSAAFVQDSAITAKVKAKLTSDITSNLSRIEVDTDKKGEVWLSGTVDSQSAADGAVQIAKAIEGVSAVHSYIEVKKEG
jgi:hypothetical protein